MSAKARGIAWELTYSQWLEIWIASGHWHERGRGRGKYVMARYGDIGSYAVGNVKIIKCETNTSEMRWTAEHRLNASVAHRGKTLTPEHRAKISAGNKRQWAEGRGWAS